MSRTKANQPQACCCPSLISAPIHITNMTSPAAKATSRATTTPAVTSPPEPLINVSMKIVAISATIHAPMYHRVVNRLLMAGLVSPQRPDIPYLVNESGRGKRRGCRHRRCVVDGAVLAREGDPAWVLAQTVLQLSPDLARPLLEPARRVGDHLLDLGDLLRLLRGQREPVVEGEVGVVSGHVWKLPTHPPLVSRQPSYRRPRKTDQRHVAVAQVDERAVEPVGQAGAAGARADRVVGAEHDVVGEQLRAAVEKLGECLLAVLGVELVLLLDPDPGQIAPRSRDLLVPLRLLGLELGEVVSGCLPFLAGSDLVLGHLNYLLSDRSGATRSRPSDLNLPGSLTETGDDPESHRRGCATDRPGQLVTSRHKLALASTLWSSSSLHMQGPSSSKIGGLA